MAGGIGLYQLLSSVSFLLRELAPLARLTCYVLLGKFSLFAIVLAGRVWSALPILQGGA